MEKEEVDNLLKSIYPEGEERWVKIKYHNYEKCIKKLRLSPPNEEDREKWIKENGFEVTSLSIRPEFEPQLTSLLELRDKCITFSSYNGGSLSCQDIERLFKEQIDKILQQTSVYPI